MKRRGASLIELLLVIFIISVMGTLVSAFIVKSQRDNNRVEAQSLVQRDLNLALDRVVKVVRSTTQVVAADSTSLRIKAYASVGDAQPSDIYLYVNGSGAVKLEITPPSSTEIQTSTLLPSVTNSSSQPLFKYYDDQGNLLSLPINVGSIRLVELLPSAKDKNGLMVQPITASTKINLRNFKTNL